MFRYGKTSQNAVSAMSCLAQCHADPEARMSSQEIADLRGLPKPLVARLLVILSQAGLVAGAPGPGGGYRLNRPPEAINLKGIVALFEKPGVPLRCPFGPDWCGNRAPCPLHDQLAELDGRLGEFLENTTLAVFTAGLGELELPGQARPTTTRRRG